MATVSDKPLPYAFQLAAAGITPDKPLHAVIVAVHEAADAARDAARGARGLTPEAETALVTALVQRVGREVNNGLARRARADVLRTGLLGVAVLSGAMTLAGAVCYGIGRAQGGDARVAELCQGSALKTEAKGGVSCLFWLTPPSRQ